jgi:hypothetical protein
LMLLPLLPRSSSCAKSQVQVAQRRMSCDEARPETAAGDESKRPPAYCRSVMESRLEREVAVMQAVGVELLPWCRSSGPPKKLTIHRCAPSRRPVPRFRREPRLRWRYPRRADPGVKSRTAATTSSASVVWITCAAPSARAAWTCASCLTTAITCTRRAPPHADHQPQRAAADHGDGVSGARIESSKPWSGACQRLGKRRVLQRNMYPARAGCSSRR